jgi:hypothetical protein
MSLKSPFSVPIQKKNSVDDLGEEMGEHRRSIKEVLADFRAKHRYARRPALFAKLAYRDRPSGTA